MSRPVSLALSLLALAGLPAVLPAQAPSAATLAVDTPSRGQVTLTFGPFDLPAELDHGAMAMGATGGHATTNYTFEWPVDGFGRGFRWQVTDREGRPLSKRLLHHMQMINTDRRQLLLPLSERTMAVGQETDNLMLPSTIGVPLSRGQRMRAQVMWHNTTGQDLAGVYLRIAVRLSPSNLLPEPVAVLPISIDIADAKGRPNTFTVPPGGEFVRTREFVMPVDARMLGMSGHMHDHGVALRLEDAENGKVLTSVTTTRDSSGRITHMPMRLFGVVGEGLRLRANHRYRLVAVYENHTGRPLPGVMAHMDGLIRPLDLRQWPVSGSPLMAYVDPPVPAGDPDGEEEEATAGGHDAGAHEHPRP